jgi:hypothetical protein
LIAKFVFMNSNKKFTRRRGGGEAEKTERDSKDFDSGATGFIINELRDLSPHPGPLPMNLRHLLSTIDVVSLLTPAPLLVERRALHARCARPDNERKPGAGEESLLPIMPNFNSFIIKWLQNVFLEGPG